MRLPKLDQLVLVNGVELCFDTLGDPADPPLLLIGGSSASMDWWEDEFCERLASGSRFVIRYDHRDTGQSVTYPPGAPGYTGPDLVADAAGLLEAFGLTGAHVVGISMGGALAQILALDHPALVASLTLVGTSPAGRAPDLPDMPQAALAEFGIPSPDWSDRRAVIDYLTKLGRAAAGSTPPFDEAAYRELVARVLDRTVDIESSMTNHHVTEGGEPWRHRLPGLEVPTLVIHGTEDPVMPYPHGEALAREIPGASLLTLYGVGHELPRPTWDLVVPAILDHTAG